VEENPEDRDNEQSSEISETSYAENMDRGVESLRSSTSGSEGSVATSMETIDDQGDICIQVDPHGQADTASARGIP
jgi:hypothetical protein